METYRRQQQSVAAKGLAGGFVYMAQGELHSLLPSCLSSCFLPAPGPALRTCDYSKQHPSPQAEAPHLELRLSFRWTQLAGGHGGQRLHLRIKVLRLML